MNPGNSSRDESSSIDNDKVCDCCNAELYEDGDPVDEIVTNPCGCVLHEYCQDKYGYGFARGNRHPNCAACQKKFPPKPNKRCTRCKELRKEIATLKSSSAAEKKEMRKEIATLKKSLAAEQKKVDKLTKQSNKNQ